MKHAGLPSVTMVTLALMGDGCGGCKAMDSEQEQRAWVDIVARLAAEDPRLAHQGHYRTPRGWPPGWLIWLVPDRAGPRSGADWRRYGSRVGAAAASVSSRRDATTQWRKHRGGDAPGVYWLLARVLGAGRR